jgi:hypothetical protein
MKKEKDLEEMRKAEEEKKYQKLKSKPDINQKSKQIAIENSHKPIYERTDQIMESRKKKMAQN